MASDFRFIGNATEGSLEEFPSKGAGDRLRKRGLTTSWRAIEAKDRSFEITRRMFDGEVLNDPLLDLVESEVILIEDLLDVIEIIVVLGLLIPRGIDEGIDVVKDERAFKRGLWHHLETLELFVDLVFDVLRIWVLRHFLLDGVDVAFLVVAFAKLIADGFHLFS